mmetsp:Transcript_22918/g.59889  ORF Transcript_22918/g.59889 Transcript_22918/m.59889 type:complete len:265 (-) Transcript_22918:1362-2156(-)
MAHCYSACSVLWGTPLGTRPMRWPRSWTLRRQGPSSQGRRQQHSTQEEPEARLLRSRLGGRLHCMCWSTHRAPPLPSAPLHCALHARLTSCMLLLLQHTMCTMARLPVQPCWPSLLYWVGAAAAVVVARVGKSQCCRPRLPQMMRFAAWLCSCTPPPQQKAAWTLVSPLLLQQPLLLTSATATWAPAVQPLLAASPPPPPPPPPHHHPLSCSPLHALPALGVYCGTALAQVEATEAQMGLPSSLWRARLVAQASWTAPCSWCLR